MYETLTVDFFPLRMFGGGDAHEMGWHITNWTGWSGGVDLEVDEIKIPGSDGYYDLEGTLSSRTAEAEGYVLAPSLPDLGRRDAELTSLLGKPLQQVVVTEFGETAYAWAKITSAPKFNAQGEFPEAQFSIAFYCPKPQKYGDENAKTVETGVVLTAVNRGNRMGTLILKVNGVMPTGYTIYGPAGKRIVVNRPVTSGHPHYIDLAKRVLRIDDVIVFGAIDRFDKWGIPGSDTVSMTCVPNTGGGTFGYAGRDTSL